MSADASGLSEVVESLRGYDIQKMSDQDGRTFKADVFKRFASATAALPQLILPPATNLDRLVWSVEPAEPYCNEWIGTFRLRSTDMMEANLSQPKRIAMAAALFPESQLIFELMGDFHYPGGLDSVPHVQIAVRVSDGPAFDALQAIDPELCAQFECLSGTDGFTLCVRTVENAMPDQVDPSNLERAIEAAVRAARKARERQDDEAEAIEVRLTLDGGSALTTAGLSKACALMGLLFVHLDF